MTWDHYYKMMLALTIWREARGEPREGRRAVGHVIRNRVRAGQGDWDHVMTKKWQFSSLTAPGDSQLVLWPDSPDQDFEDIMLLVEGIFDNSDEDITGGALFYFNPSVVLPTWASSMTKTGLIGHHLFMKPTGLWSSKTSEKG